MIKIKILTTLVLDVKFAKKKKAMIFWTDKSELIFMHW